MRFCTLFFLFFARLLAAQTPCTPASPVAADYPATEAALKSLFERHKPKYSEAEFNTIRRQLEQCNAVTDRELDGLVSEMSNLSLKYQQVLAYKDVGGLEKQIRDLEESRKKSRMELEQNLGYVKHTGIFAVLLESIDPYENKNTLIGKANAAISPVAVQDLVGAYLTRASTVQDYAPVRDVVQSFVGGETKVEKEYFNQPNYQKNYFLYVVKTGATPLKQKPAGAEAGANALVLNLASDSDFRARLRGKGVSEEHINRIERDVLPYLADVQRDNNAADSRQDDILLRGTEEINRLDRELEDARQRLKTRSAKINSICKELGLAFDARNIDGSVNTALQNLRTRIQERTARWSQTKESEIIFKETRTFIEGEPAQALATEALNACRQLEQGYGKVDRLLQITEVENLDVTRYDANRTLTVYRNPRRLWAYPIPMDDGSFKLAVLVQFKVTGQQQQQETTVEVPVQKPWVKQFDYEPDMAFVEGGTFTMGCTSEQGGDCYDDEKSIHQVTLSGFYMAKHEVTQAQWKAVMGTNPAQFNNCDQCPVEQVSWDDIQDFLKKLNQKTGKNYRLPTEAEWEFAARGGTKTKGYKYAGSNNLDEMAWYSSNSGSSTHAVGGKKANELGLFDMSGNVWEWCSDWYGAYASGSQNNPKGPSTGSIRVYRGGGWGNSARFCRVAIRLDRSPGFRDDGVGFRLSSSSL